MSAIRLSHPGQEPRLVIETDPYWSLTERQRRVVDVVRFHCGNRSHAAKQLGVRVRAVQASVHRARLAGVSVPPGRTRKGIPNSRTVVLTPRCTRPMDFGATCGRRENHPRHCISVEAWRRKRT
jgi:hypothetical protein